MLLISLLQKLSILLHVYVLLKLFSLEDYLENLTTFKKILYKNSLAIFIAKIHFFMEDASTLMFAITSCEIWSKAERLSYYTSEVKIKL